MVLDLTVNPRLNALVDNPFTKLRVLLDSVQPQTNEPPLPWAVGEPQHDPPSLLAETLAKNGCPVRTIHLEHVDERHLGELLMHFMLETIIAAHLLGVDPFDQPAVEEGKILAKKYLVG